MLGLCTIRYNQFTNDNSVPYLDRSSLEGVATASDAFTYGQWKVDYRTTVNSDLNPAFFISLTSAKDVSTITKTARTLQCPFAV